MPWVNIEVIDLEVHKAFIYHILNNDTGEQYIGKKNLYSTTHKPPLKGRVNRRKTVKESNWLVYQSSSTVVKQWTNVTKTILYPCTHVGEATYLEVQYLMANDVLNPDNNYVNKCIGKYMRWYELPDLKI